MREVFYHVAKRYVGCIWRPVHRRNQIIQVVKITEYSPTCSVIVRFYISNYYRLMYICKDPSSGPGRPVAPVNVIVGDINLGICDI